MVDTCAAEFAATTRITIPYTAAKTKLSRQTTERKSSSFGSGPIRIGQGIEFDFCSVHCTWAFKKEGL